MALLVPGVWLLSVWCCVTPAIIIENKDYNCFNRSAQLTKEYRWPCAGVFVIVGICSFIPLMVVNWLNVFGFASTEFASASVFILLQIIAMAFFTAMTGICTALIYTRLREIKEGTRVEQLANVFA